MDVDDDQEFGMGASKLTYPGESLTSSQAYMRYIIMGIVLLACILKHYVSEVMERMSKMKKSSLPSQAMLNA